MTPLSELAARFAEKERPAGNLLDADALLAQALAATRFYAGYATPRAREGIDPPPAIDGDLPLSESEWALIRPLFLLYVERENALQLEASRGLGVDPFGRASSEVAGDIANMEADMPRRAFFSPVVTV